jgi:hypothetical protein
MSARLPRSLARWAAQLDVFDGEIALALAPLAQKLAAVIGPYVHRHTEGRVAPDGFGGLAKRGSYERLIASDWMLADELPEEFMRRSVMGEHLFWKLAYREPAQSRSVLALFDAGPEQLGAPRLLHLATLAVLHARAQRLKVAFHWAVLQGEDMYEGMSAQEIKIFLGARGHLSATAEDFERWSARTDEAALSGEIWIIGGDRSRRFAPRQWSALRISEPLEPGVAKLRAEVCRAGKPARSIELQLPAPQLCARALRDPFPAVRPKPAVPPAATLPVEMQAEGMVFFGRRLYMLAEKKHVLSALVPNSTHARQGGVRRYEIHHETPVAVGRSSRATVVAAVNDSRTYLSLRSYGRTVFLADGNYQISREDAARLPRGFSHLVCHGPNIYLLGAMGSLLRMFRETLTHRSQTFELIYDRALAISQKGESVCIASWDAPPRQSPLVRVLELDSMRSLYSFDTLLPPQQAFFGYGTDTDSPVFGLLAVGYGERQWEITNGKSRWQLVVPPGFTVWGVLRQSGYEETLVVVEDDGYSVSLCGIHGIRNLLRCSSRVTAMAVSQDLPLIACHTANGEYVVYSVRHGATVLAFKGAQSS